MKRFTCGMAAVFLAVALVPLGGQAGATFPGAVGRIAFASDREGGTYNIFTMNPDGSNPARVTNHPAEDRNPVWDPKARHLLFVSLRSGTPDIYRIDDTGGIVRIITETGDRNENPAYDAGRDIIIFQTDRDDNEEIYSMETNGKNPRNLTLHQPRDLPPDNPASNIDPHVGSNGRIVFASDRETAAGDYEIFTMRLDGSDVRRIDPFDRDADDPPYSNTQPKWSPDASRIAFVSDIEGNPEIYVMNANGDNPVRLTTDPENNPADDANPVWSPDGAQIAWDSDRHAPGTNREIYVMNRNGSSKTRVTNNGVNDVEPAWQSVKDRHAFDEETGSPRLPVSDGRELGRGADVGVAAAVAEPAGAGAGAPAAEPAEASQEKADDPPEVLVVRETVEVRVPQSYPMLEAGAVLALIIALGFGAFATRRRFS